MSIDARMMSSRSICHWAEAELRKTWTVGQGPAIGDLDARLRRKQIAHTLYLHKLHRELMKLTGYINQI